ncbi:hypothetical protein AAVH_30761, partial [Aphelenchoides avenae]
MYRVLMFLLVYYVMVPSVITSCAHPERFPSEFVSDAATWCKAAEAPMWCKTSNVWTAQKVTYATVIFQNWPATVNDLHRAANSVLPSAVAGVVDYALYPTTFYLALIRPTFEFFGLLYVHLIRESLALMKMA